MRLYHNTSRSQRETSDMLCELFCRYSHLDLCLVTHLYLPHYFDEQDHQKKIYTPGITDREDLHLRRKINGEY